MCIRDRGGPGQTITLHRGGLATSTTTVRRWRRGGRLVHHIIDPATGAPAEGCWRTVSVAADTALAANTASTAAIVLGEQAESWLCQRHLAARHRPNAVALGSIAMYTFLLVAALGAARGRLASSPLGAANGTRAPTTPM